MDRRNFQVLTANKNLEKTCIHTKSIFSLIDLDFEDDAFVNIKKHADKCIACSSALSKFELENQQASFFIPKPQIDTETKNVFHREVREIFKTLEINEKEKIRIKIKNNIKKIDTAGVEFIKNLSSKNMIKTYALGVVMFVVLKQFFN